jgi:hypothetical protein
MARLTDKQRRTVKIRFSTNPKIAKQQRAIVEKARVKKDVSLNELLLSIVVDKCEDITGEQVQYD